MDCLVRKDQPSRYLTVTKAAHADSS